MAIGSRSSYLSSIRSILLRGVLALSLLTLLMSGLWAGLIRIGWLLPGLPYSLVAVHGPLLACGVLGTLICLERAVALGQSWAFISPLLTLAGGLGLVFGLPVSLVALLIAGGSLGLLIIFMALLKRQPARFVVTMALGAGAWLGGNLLWLGSRPFALVALWWASFLVLTIVGERLELGRLRQLPVSAHWLFTLAIAVLMIGLAASLIDLDLGMRIVGTSFVGQGLWLLRYDIARRTIRKPGLPRFSAICILSGAVWLIVAGLIALAVGAVYAGPVYDALLHAIFLGFVFAMIFGHAPIIAPALLKLPLVFSRLSYVPLTMLHGALLMRLIADLTEMFELRRGAGMLNAISIVLYLVILMLVTLHKVIFHTDFEGLRDPQS